MSRIRLLLTSCADPAFRRMAAGAGLVVADPPWRYGRAAGMSSAQDHYDGLSHVEIAHHLSALGAPLLALWLTTPQEGEWDRTIGRLEAAGGWPWGPHVTSGAWVKSSAGDGPGLADADGGLADGGHYGPGYWWAGCYEPLRLYRRGRPPAGVPDRSVVVRSVHHEPPGAHSRKPVAWMRTLIRRWTQPGALVVDPYAGLGAVAEACMLEGRAYLGAEIDPERRAAALERLARVPR